MISFTTTTATPYRYGPRLGSLALRTIVVDTPGHIVSTSRGVVPHLSGRDQFERTPAIRALHVPFESFLETSPPVPTLQQGPYPLHTFLGYNPAKHLLTLALRNPAIGDTPANGNDYVSASTGRGMKKVTTEQWRTYVRACAPDIVVALPDIPWTPPPFSQKRITKSIERTAAWLAHLLAQAPEPLNILVHMAGGVSSPARRAFADSLMETLHGREADDVHPHKCLDDGVAGYVFDMAPLRRALDVTPDEGRPEIADLLKASLLSTSPGKLRLVNTPASPHEVLRLIRDVGIDIFDSKWAQDAAHVGVALDFVFPVLNASGTRRLLGHNLYRTQYAHDFSSFSDSAPCSCAACTPVAPASVIAHGALDEHAPTSAAQLSSYTRAYVHHLLHTHEMSAHALLVMHNITVLDTFFAGVRTILQCEDDFNEHVNRFATEYTEDGALLEEARAMWKDVDLARGKGRLARERAAVEAIPVPI